MACTRRNSRARTARLCDPVSWLVERRVERLAEDRAADGGEHLVIVVVADVDGEVAIDAFDGAGTIERPRAARAHRVLDRLLRQVLDQMPRARAGQPRLDVVAGLPQT